MFSTHAFLLLFLHFTFFSVTLQQGTLPPKAFNPGRLQVMRDALSWMTFRKNGKLATDQDLEPFLEALKLKYTQSKYFRTFIAAFKDGVLPRLTLQETDPCDPAYTKEYRDPYNNSVTFSRLKEFTFKYYDERSPNRVEICDYRQGLVCNQQTRKCECPMGSKMGPISQGSSDQRCQMEENEICALIDLDHDPTSKYGALKKVLPEMLFNLEKPLSCKLGTQCRFKDNSQISPSCYNNKGGPWAKGRWGLNLGEECTLGLYANNGPCRGSDIGLFSGYTCYNFGALKPAVPPLVGLCAHDIGSYGITSGWSSDGDGGGLLWNPLFIGFVSPATTPLRGNSLRQYYFKFLDLYQSLREGSTPSVLTEKENGPCNLAKTGEMLDHWKFFLSLEATPPPGKDHVATEAELQNRLQQISELTVDKGNKTCKVYARYTSEWYIQKALRCVPNGGSPDKDGNDGKCQVTPENEDVTWAWAHWFQEFRKHIGDTYAKLNTEENKYRLSLIGRVEIECDPTLGYPQGSEGAPPTDPGDNDVLEGGYCAPGRGCYKNYGDYLNIYENNMYCSWEDGSGEEALFRDCQWMDKTRKFGKCEERKLDGKIKEELSQFSSSSGLGRGDQCDYEFEKRIRKGIKDKENKVDGNKYHFLWEFQNVKNGVKGYDGFCDRTRLLECTDKGTCECVGGTAPRRVIYEGVEYMSDYCYLTYDQCYKNTLQFLCDSKGCVEQEKDGIEKHYEGEKDKIDCDGSNWCVYVAVRGDDYDYDNYGQCTTFNTGHTGFPPRPQPETEKPGGGTGGGGDGTFQPKPPVCDEQDPYCDYEDAGKGENQLHEGLKMIMIILMMIRITI